MPSEQALDYDLKEALLRRYDMREDGFKRKYRSCRPEASETFSQFSVRLESYFHRWIEMSKISTTFEGLYDLMVRDQFIYVCSKELNMFLEERVPDTLGKMATLADQYREARYTTVATLINKGKQSVAASSKPVTAKRMESTNAEESPKPQVSSNTSTSFVPLKDRKCYKCNKPGHMAQDCTYGRVSNIQEENVPTDNFCGAVTIPSDSIIETSVSMVCEPTSTNATAYMTSKRNAMPICSGYVNGKKVSVLRDSGCSGIVVKRSLVTEEAMTGQNRYAS